MKRHVIFFNDIKRNAKEIIRVGAGKYCHDLKRHASCHQKAKIFFSIHNKQQVLLFV
jgi:hypothetical protein